MERKISKIALLTLLISFLFVSIALANGEQHIELSDPEPGVDKAKEPDAVAKPDQTSEDTKTKSSEKESSEPEDRTEKKKAVDHSEAEDHGPGASYELITPAQPGYIFAVAIVLFVVALLVMAVFFL